MNRVETGAPAGFFEVGVAHGCGGFGGGVGGEAEDGWHGGWCLMGLVWVLAVFWGGGRGGDSVFVVGRAR